MIKPARLLCAVAALSLAGCGIFFPNASQRAGKNTDGFAAGYNDGCASANSQSTSYRKEMIRDESAYANDKTYRAGWSSGMYNCRTATTHDPSKGPIPDNEPGGH